IVFYMLKQFVYSESILFKVFKFLINFFCHHLMQTIIHSFHPNTIGKLRRKKIRIVFLQFWQLGWLCICELFIEAFYLNIHSYLSYFSFQFTFWGTTYYKNRNK